MTNKLNEDDLFDLVDACSLRDEQPAPRRKAERKRPDLLELYTRRPRRIRSREPLPEDDFDEWGFMAVTCIGFGVYVYLALVVCLG